MKNSDIKPSTIMLIVGGAGLLISTFLNWGKIIELGARERIDTESNDEFIGLIRWSAVNGWETDRFGLLGVFCALIGLVVGGGAALRQFGSISMPDKILGFNHQQLHLILGVGALLITIGLGFPGDVAIGLWIATLASIILLIGAVMDLKAGQAEAPPPA